MAIEKFFGCCSLKTGVITLAILALVRPKLLWNQKKKIFFTFQILDTILLSFIIAILTNWEGYFQNYFKNYNVIENYFNYASVVLIADQVASILLLYGALRRKKNFILPWLIVNGTLVSCFVTITAIFVGFLCVLLICFGE